MLEINFRFLKILFWFNKLELAFHCIGKFQHVLNCVTLWVVFYAYFIFFCIKFYLYYKWHRGNYLKLEGDFLKAAVATPAVLISKAQRDRLPSLLYLQDHSQRAPLNEVESRAERGRIVFWSVVELLFMQQLLQTTLSVYSFCSATMLK